MASMVKGTISITAVLILATVVMAAQSERGTIRGTVTDATGSVMPGVAVKAVNVDTGIETSTVTTDAGLYSIPQVKPGNYRVEAERTGSKTRRRAHLAVDVTR